MRRVLTAAAAASLLVTTIGQQPAVAALARNPVVTCPSGPSDCWPTAFAFTRSGDQLFYVERFTGEIRRFTLKGGVDRLWGVVQNVAGAGEQGVLGLDLDPRWGKKKKHRWVYVYYTHDDPSENRIIRMRKRKHGGGLRTDHLLTIPGAALYHNGGPIHFGPDKMLYAVTGEAHDPARAQDLADPGGKVLRLTRTGGRPGDNPIPGSSAFSFGHRNSFGFTFDPETGTLWQTENGPGCNDEVNLILPGGNYAWGSSATCSGTAPDNTNQDGPAPRMLPERLYEGTIVPTGATFCDGCKLGLAGRLLFSTFGGDIRALTLTGDRMDVAGEQVAFTNPEGVITLESAPNGRVYFSDRSGIYRLVQS